MEIRAYTIADLKTALASIDFWQSETLPITKHRAIAHIHNPRADEQDVVLLVAYRERDVIGYLGILPDKIFIDGETFKLGWLTSWWVNPQRASAGAGTALLFKALNAHQNHIGVSGSSRAAAKVLQASRKFVAISPLRGLEVRLRPGAALTADSDRIAGLSYEYTSAIDEETRMLLQRHNRADLTRKGKADLDWIMTYPWVLTAPLKDSASRKFYFSSIAARFFYLGVKVMAQNGGLIGFMLLKVRDGQLSLLYAYYDDPEAGLISAALAHHARALKTDRLSVYDPRLLAGMEQLQRAGGSGKAVSRDFLLSKPFAHLAWAQCRLQGGDGDLAFY